MGRTRMLGSTSRRGGWAALAAGLVATLGLTLTTGPATADGYEPDPTGGLGTGYDPGDGSYVVATFNVLGNSHTAGSDPRPSGARRMVWTMELLEGNDVDLVGLQELEPKQLRAMERLAGATWRIYSPPGDPRDSIAWRRDRFTLAGRTAIRIPYKRNQRLMPVVVLRDRTTGKKTIVVSVHNVAGQGAKWAGRREVSIRRELAAIARYRARTGWPVIFMGDFNDRTEGFYCRMRDNGLASSNAWWIPEVFPEVDPLLEPVDPEVPVEPLCIMPRRSGIDWIFGTEDVDFTGYLKLDGGLVDQASDHPLVIARVAG